MIARAARHIASATRGSLVAGEPTRLATSVSIDSRTSRPGDVFFAIVGPRHDGHAFVGEAAARGALIAVVSNDVDAPEGMSLIRVDDTTDALGRLAADERQRRALRVVGITGSSGKTTTRLLATAAIGAGLRTASSTGNLNNQWGVPLSILRLDDDCEAAVIEMGMSGPGEIAALTRIAVPDVGVITNVGTAHIGFFKDVMGIASAKTELLTEMPADGIGVVHSGSPELLILAEQSGRPLIRFDLDDREADLSASVVSSDLVDGTRYVFGEQRGRLQLWGHHAVLNALAALGACKALGIDLPTAMKAMEAVQPLEGRGRVHRLGEGVTVVDESYNANPSAVRAVLEALSRVAAGGRRIAILGDMLELGAKAEGYHEQIGRLAVRLGVNALVAVGEFAEIVARAARSAGLDAVDVVADAEAARERALELVGPGDLVVVKGSRSVGLEAVRDGLIERFGESPP